MSFNSGDYGKNVIPKKPDDYVCPSCTFRNLTLKSVKCRYCIFRKEHPNYKLDVRIANMKLDDYPGFKVFFEGEKK